MTKDVEKITLSPSRDIPFDELMLSQSNVRRIKAGVSVEELAEDIAGRGLLQSLNVRPVLNDDRTETGKFEIPAGGRRFQALSLLVKKKRLAKTTPIPCIVGDAGSAILAEQDSLAESMQRVDLHPLDQIRAFVSLRYMSGPRMERTRRPRSRIAARLAFLRWGRGMISASRTRITMAVIRGLCWNQHHIRWAAASGRSQSIPKTV